MNAASMFGVSDPVLESREDVTAPALNLPHEVEEKHHDSKENGQAVVLTTSHGINDLQNTQDDGFKTSFAEYIHFAGLRRQVEDNDRSDAERVGLSRLFHRTSRSKNASLTTIDNNNQALDERGQKLVGPNGENGIHDSEGDLLGLSERSRELANARRVLRMAGWSQVFYLVTCDILGPFNAPFAIASIGLVPGVLLYVLFGAVAALTGVMLSRIFCRLDSVRFPIRTYGDLGERLLGSWARYLFSTLQSIQLVLNVGLLVLTNGQSLSQITKANLCFAVCIVIWAFVGMVIGQIRSLKNFALLANSTVWINLLIIFLSMGFVAYSPPNFTAAMAQYGIGPGPIIVSATLPGQALFTQINGVFNMVFAYGGAMIFPEIMAEMRRPRDFIKGMAMAQALIFTCYVLYGCFVYAYQGQFTLAVAYQGVSKYSWQTVGNVLALITGIIAAGLYGNIGLKVLYANIVEGYFNGPPLMSHRGRWLWSFLVVFYWALGFIIGTSIPAVGALSGLVAATCIFQFTYTFPPLLMLALEMRLDASEADEPFTTPGVAPRQIDTWRNWSRWQRGFFGGGRRQRTFKALNFLFLLTALATAGLGLWATGTDLRAALAAGAATSFGCAAAV